jgi:hypothetical protein
LKIVLSVSVVDKTQNLCQLFMERPNYVDVLVNVEIK